MARVWIRLGSVCGALVVSAAGCGAILGIHEIAPPTDGGTDTGADTVTDEDHAALDGMADVAVDAKAFDVEQDALDASQDTLEASPGPLDARADSLADAQAADAGDGDGSVQEPDLPCAQQGTYLFCDDFDSVASVDQTWSGSVVALDGGTWSLDTSDHVSSPASARAAGPALAPSGVGQLDDYLNVPPLTSWIRLALDVRVDVPTYIGIPMVGVAHIYVDASTSILYEILQNGTAQIVVFTSSGANNFPVAAPPVGTWVRIVLQYDRSTGMTAWQSGSAIASDGAASGVTPSAPIVFLGATGVQGTSSEPFALEIDNVVVRGQ